jgi:hypothetical protein
VLSELRVNQLATPAVEERLGRGVIAPLATLARERMPAAAEALEQLSESDTPDTQQAARSTQEAVLDDMNAVAERMLEWQRFQEAVILLRNVLRMQRDVSEETETRIETDIIGNLPRSGPSNSREP